MHNFLLQKTQNERRVGRYSARPNMFEFLELIWSCTSDKFRCKIQLQNQHCSVFSHSKTLIWDGLVTVQFPLNAVSAMFFISFAFHAIQLRVGSYLCCCLQLRVARIYSAVFTTCNVVFNSLCVLSPIASWFVWFYLLGLRLKYFPIPWASLRCYFSSLLWFPVDFRHYNVMNSTEVVWKWAEVNFRIYQINTT